MDFITKSLAPILYKLRTKNPKIWAILMLVLLVVQYVITKGVELGAFEISPLTGDIKEWTDFILLLIAGAVSPKVYPFLKNPKRPETQDDLNGIRL